MKILTAMAASLLLCPAVHATEVPSPPEWDLIHPKTVAFYCTAYSHLAATTMMASAEFTPTQALNALRHEALWNTSIKSERHLTEKRNAAAYIASQSASAKARQLTYCGNMARAIIELLDAKEAAKLERATIAAYQAFQASSPK